MSQTIDSVVEALQTIDDQQLPLFVQVGYNRFDIISYDIKDGYCVLVIGEAANNPTVTAPEVVA
jgi:hypothetical protein